MKKNMTWQLLVDIMLFRKRAAEDLDFPLWQSNLFLACFAVLFGVISFWPGVDDIIFGIVFALLVVFLSTFVSVKVVYWWLRRKGDFTHDFSRTYNLIVAASLFPSVYTVLTSAPIISQEIYESLGFMAIELLFIVISIYILIHAFMHVLGADRTRTVVALVLSGVAAIIVSAVLISIFSVVAFATGLFGFSL